MSHMLQEQESTGDLLSGMYEHYKGGKYVVLGVAAVSDNNVEENSKLVVVYVSLDATRPGPRMRTRDYAEFVEQVKWPDGEYNYRFKYVGNIHSP